MSANKQGPISKRWGLPFWNIVRDLHAQDLTRKQAAAALGYSYQSFSRLLIANLDKSPWERSSVVTRYLLETGETLRTALDRLAATGHSCSAAARVIGYSQGSELLKAMRARGIEVVFHKRSPNPNLRSRGKPTGKGRWPSDRPTKSGDKSSQWPTWQKVNEMTPGMGGTHKSAWLHHVKGKNNGQV